mgnify:CR=1 FL=1
MKIAVSTDERTHLVDVILDELKKRGHEIIYFGPESDESVDWPVVTCQTAEMVARGDADEGIVMCWTGTGCSIASNKVKGIRAALYYGKDIKIVRLSRTHNNTNILSLGAKFLTKEEAIKAVNIWLETDFSSEPRHLRRIKKISDAE